MQLDDFLNSRSIGSLQLLQWFWGAGSSRSASKSELLRLLRQAMLQPERVRQSFDALGAAAQDLLRALLRQEGYEADAALLFRRVSQPPATPHAEREVLDELSRRGFVSHTAARTSERLESLRATVPQELGDVVAGVLNLDIREPGVMLSLRQRLAQPGQPQQPPTAELLAPHSVEERIAALPDHALQRAVRLALDDHAGIIPLERFPSLGLDVESVDSPRWRTALEGAHLGTFGHLSLLDHALGDDHDCLVLYQELVEAHAAAQAADAPALDHTYACGIDFLTDLMAAVDFLRANPCRLTAAGRLFRGARNQFIPLTALRTSFFMDEETLLAHKLSVAQELGLLELHDDGRVHATRAAAAWEQQPLAEQALALLDALLRLGEGSCPPNHFRALAAVARDLLSESPPGLWYPTGAFLARVLARFLLGRIEAGPTPGPGPAAPDVRWWRHTHALNTVGALAAAAREPLLQALNYAGILDLGRRGDRAFVAASRLAPVILRGQSLPSPAGRIILVNPDSEVILFPDDGHVELLHRLCAFCERGKSEVTLHLRITQESVQRAVLRGLSSDEMIATLHAHCRAPVSQNIEYSIRTWAARVHPAGIRTVHVLELPSAEALDAALRLPEIAPLVVQRLSPTVASLRVPQLDTDAEDALRKLGIYLM